MLDIKENKFLQIWWKGRREATTAETECFLRSASDKITRNNGSKLSFRVEIQAIAFRFTKCPAADKSIKGSRYKRIGKNISSSPRVAQAEKEEQNVCQYKAHD